MHTVVCRADTGLVPGDGSTPGRVRMLGAIIAGLPLVGKKEGLITSGNVSQTTTAKEGPGGIPRKM